MAAISFPQALALNYGTFINPSTNTSYRYSLKDNLSGDADYDVKETPIKNLLSGRQFSGIIGSFSLSPSTAITISGLDYTLVTSSTDVNPSGLDYLFGGDISGNGLVETTEQAYHKTGLAILIKLKK